MKGNPEQLVKYLFHLDKSKIYEIKEVRNKRSLNSNAKYWSLLNQLSLKLRIGIEELHFQMLKSYSQRYEILLPDGIDPRGIEYCERKSKINRDGREFNIYHVYTPSHELNTAEFALLMEGLINECQQQGIETRSPDEIERDNQLLRGM